VRSAPRGGGDLEVADPPDAPAWTTTEDGSGLSIPLGEPPPPDPPAAVAVEYYHLDALGSVRAVTDELGQVLSQHDFLPFGEEYNPQNPPKDRKLFTGQERDFETGLDYFNARQLRPDLGRFLMPDPLSGWPRLTSAQGFEAYGYALNNPLRFIDPTGLEATGRPGAQAPLLEDGGSFAATDAPWGGGNSDIDDVFELAAEHAAFDASQAQQQNPTPLTDKNGNVVQGANGQPALIPGGFDVNGVVTTGQSDAEMRKNAPMVGLEQTLEDLANFRRGGKWDLQRLSGQFDPRFVDSATILIGMYAASAGITRNQILNIENTVAIGSQYAKGTLMDSTYTHLPVRNVTNTDIGMRLVRSGAYVR
jgi:RHS repeat-associated protein